MNWRKEAKKIFGLGLIAAASLLMSACGSVKTPAEPTATPTPIPANIYEGIVNGKYKAGVSVHDPSILPVDGGYYLYGSHMANAFTTDLRTFKYCGNGYNSKNQMFVDLFSADCGIFDYAGDNGNNSYSVWAPHVFYNKAMGKYCMYMCTSSTYIWSSICFATSDSPAGPFEWQENILYSGFTKDDLAKTDVLDVVSESYVKDTYLKRDGSYLNISWPNCIDPTCFYDEDGRLWMVYGSWSGGIFLLELDEKTGRVIHPAADKENEVDPYFGKKLLGGGHHSIEGPYIEYDAEAGYYYLFVSYGELQREGGYQIRVFRSKKPDGPYLDMNGEKPSIIGDHAQYGLKLSGNYRLPSLTSAYMATGHQSSMIDKDGKRYMCYHTRFEKNGEFHEPRINQYFINAEGWPVMAPFITDGETLSTLGYGKDKLTGTYFFINQGTDISKKIAEPVLIELKEDGRVEGAEIRGTWSVENGSCNMQLEYDGKNYSGVFILMKDQAGTEVMCFTAAGANESIWGVHYFNSAE